MRNWVLAGVINPQAPGLAEDQLSIGATAAERRIQLPDIFLWLLIGLLGDVDQHISVKAIAVGHWSDDRAVGP